MAGCSRTRLHLPRGIDAVNTLDRHFHEGAIAITRIGEIDSPLAVYYNIIRTVVAYSFVPIGEDADFARLHVRPNDAAPSAGPQFGALATEQPPLGIKGVAVGPPTGVPEIVSLPVAESFQMRLFMMSLKKTLPSASAAGPR